MLPSVAGADGVGRTTDGRRVYFVLPEAPYGALAQKSLVRSKQCVAVPDSLDDVSAAAIANPGMSAWAALADRARLQPGEIVLVNGATGTAGRLAVQLAKYLGASKVIGTGRNESELEELLSLGADVVIPFQLGTGNPAGAKQHERALIAEFTHGIDVVIDYLWGESAKTIIVAIARAVEDARPVCFVHMGGASHEQVIHILPINIAQRKSQFTTDSIRCVHRAYPSSGFMSYMTSPTMSCGARMAGRWRCRPG